MSTRFFFFHLPTIDSTTANSKQVLYTAQMLSRKASVTFIGRCGRDNKNDVAKHLSQKISAEPTFQYLFFAGNKLKTMIAFFFVMIRLLANKKLKVDASCNRLNTLESANCKEDGSSRFFVYTRSPSIAGMALLLGLKVILEMHQDVLSTNSLLSALLAKLIRRALIKDQCRVVCISESLSHILSRKFMLVNLSVLHDSVMFDENLEELLEKPNIPGLAVYTGKLGAERGIDHILALADKNPTLKFRVLGGDPSQAEYYRNKAKELGLKNIKFLGFCRKKRVDWYQARADVLLAFWSKQVKTMEYCSPLKLFEYMATGNKILLHDFSVFDEVLSDATQIKKVSSDDFNDMNNGLKELVAYDLALNNKRMLSEYTVSEFSYEARAEAIMAVAK